MFRMAAEDVFRPDIPSTARMYDYYLGGKNNYPADREAAERVINMMPPGSIRATAKQNREFLGRAVRFLRTDAGVHQFIDIGTGLPTMNQVHQVAGQGAHVVYADNDPVVLAHARDMLEGEPGATIIRHDLRDTDSILADPELREMIDFGQPVALLLIAILHFISDSDRPAEIIRALTEPMAGGSYLVISHATSDSDAGLDDVKSVYAKATSNFYSRSRAQVTALFDGFDILEPGIVELAEWRPQIAPPKQANVGPSLFWCGVGRKR
jgi:hypothetical protein